MPRSSPQTERLIEIVEFLAARRNVGGSASAIARHLDVDRATCYPMLRTLSSYGWLVREPGSKRFFLGPSLVAIGSTAESSVETVEASRPVMSALADATDIACVLVCASAGNLIVTEIMHPCTGRRATLGLRIGDTYTFRAPLGAVLVAWDGEEAFSSWCDTSTDTVDVTRRALRMVRQRGFAVEALDRPRDLQREVEEARAEALTRRETQATIERLAAAFPTDLLVGDLRACESMRVLTVSAPVFSRAGDPSAALCLFDLPAVDGAEVQRLGGLVAIAAAEITAALAGDR